MKTAIYLGPIEELFLEDALLRENEDDESGDTVLAQFDNVNLPRNWTYYWNVLPKSDFQIYKVDVSEDDTI